MGSCERLPWKPQDVGDARVVGCPLRKAATTEWNQPKRKNCIAVKKAERFGDLKSPLMSNVEMQILEFAQLAFGLALV